jgi:membrane-associated protease RseP (regulator of RpoE activity)
MSKSGIPLPPPETHGFGPYQVIVVRPQRPRYWLHFVLLLLTLITTTIVGAQLQRNFDHGVPVLRPGDTFLPLFPIEWLVRDPQAILRGTPFSLTLLLILLAHEMGHYVYARRRGVASTLPFFIPAPTLIGTLGAFIRIKSYIPSREALFDIGIAGPIAGFVVAVPAMLAGLLLSHPGVPLAPDDAVIGFPVIFEIGRQLLSHATRTLLCPLSALNLHPIAIAAWAGMLATALNLLPGSQLDGGHIVYAVSPRAHKWTSVVSIIILLPLAYYVWLGWFFWAAVLGMIGLRHPNVPLRPGLSPARRRLALFALLILVLTFIPAPFLKGSLRDALRENNIHIPFLSR